MIVVGKNQIFYLMKELKKLYADIVVVVTCTTPKNDHYDRGIWTLAVIVVGKSQFMK